MKVEKPGTDIIIHFTPEEDKLLAKRVRQMLIGIENPKIDRSQIKDVLEDIYSDYPGNLSDAIEQLLKCDKDSIPTSLANKFIAANIFVILNESVFGRRK